jgi:hypothetical protein
VIASPDAFLDFVNLFNNIAIVGFIRRDDLICLLIGIKRSNDVSHLWSGETIRRMM